MDAYDVAVVGHFSIDSIIIPSQLAPVKTLGGAVAYTSLTAQQLGCNVVVLSKVGDDFPQVYMRRLKRWGIDCSRVRRLESAQTTSFMLTYDEQLSNRSIKIVAIAPPLTTTDVAGAPESKVIHIAPIANEVTNEVAEQLRKKARTLSLDPQGLLRVFDSQGQVMLRPTHNMKILEMVDVYKSSIEEILVLTGKPDIASAIGVVHSFGVKLVLVTLSQEGVLLSTGEGMYRIPAYPNRRVVDPTGAGDVFIGGFIAEYIHKKDPVWCSCVGAAAASVALEHVGTSFRVGKAETYQRATWIYEKRIKQPHTL
jgi:sugar/nucleoside kinase (ribokinase family)